MDLLFHSKSKLDDGKYLSNFARLETGSENCVLKIDHEMFQTPNDILKNKEFLSIEHAFQCYKLAISGASEDVIDKLMSLEDMKEVKKMGGKGSFKKLKLELDVKKWSGISDNLMRHLVKQRLLVDNKYKSIVQKYVSNGGKLYHFERSGIKSKYGGYFEKPTGNWVGQNLLGKMIMEEFSNV
jgi:predicted NAD-dependent protein-ADP-ribosyltransferase YbiA (DUF1768 family)